MHTKLAGHNSLHDMIKSVVNDTREKIASSTNTAKKPAPVAEKVASVDDTDINLSESDDVEKLASALEYLGEKIAADSTYLAGEKKQGGEVLATMTAVSGKQAYKKDTSKSHSVPMKTGLQPGDGGQTDNTQTPNDHAKAPGGSPYPKKGVLKTAASKVADKIEALKKTEEPTAEETAPEAAKEEKVEDNTEKRSSALEFILNKMEKKAEGEVERRQGGETLDSKSGDGPKPDRGSKGGNNVRSNIQSNAAATNMKKVDGKGPQKKMLSEVLTEPAYSKAHDSKVHENLRNASKGGVKIAAAKAFLSKIASEGCTCSGKGECKYCKMKMAMDKKSAASTSTVQEVR